MSFLFVAVLLILVVGFAFWTYFGREHPVRGRGLLAAVRATILALILLLLWNPSIPGGAVSDDDGPGMILLDGSLSMSALDTAGTPVWDLALDRLRELDGPGQSRTTARLLLFGGDFRAFEASAPASLAARMEEETPTFVSSELAPALERAAEAGARSVTVVSDFRLGDAMAARDVAERLDLALRLERVGDGVRNAGIGDFELPPGVEAGDSVPVEVVLFGESPGAPAPRDSIALEIREGERLVAARTLLMPEGGQMTRVSLTLPPPQGIGTVEYRARVQLEGDGFPLDDERVGHVTVDPEEGGIVLLSWRPDWEPRFLLPVLERVTGLAGYGYLRTEDDRYLTMSSGPGRGGGIAEGALRARMARADLLVLHGIDGTAPAWLRETAEGASRLILFPLDREGAAVGGISTGSALTGEWYADSELPASPLAAALSGMELGALPPLARLLPLAEGEGGVVPLRLQLQGSGGAQAALVLDAEGARRRAVPLASGFWRWGFRDGAGRQSYRRLWAGVSGWLLGNQPLAGGPGVRPESSILPRGLEIPWRAQGMDGEPLAVRILVDDSVALDTLVRVGENAGFQTPSLPPGRYRYIVRGVDADGAPPGSEGTPERGSGSFRVEAWSGELALAPRDLLPATRAGADGGSGGEAQDGGRVALEAGSGSDEGVRHGTRPLRTHPAPFLLLLVLLCGEWIGRRGRGLR